MIVEIYFHGGKVVGVDIIKPRIDNDTEAMHAALRAVHIYLAQFCDDWCPCYQDGLDGA